MKIKLAFFAAGLLLGLYLLLIWCTVFQTNNDPGAGPVALKDLTQKVTSEELPFVKKTDSLSKMNKALSVQLQQTKKQLTEAKKKAGDLQLQVFELLDTRFAVQQDQYPLPLADCDSLALAVGAMIGANEKKDSLYEEVTGNLEAQLRNKDSTITLQGQLQQSLKSTFLLSIQKGESLNRENKLLQRKMKRQKVKSRLLSAAMLLFSGAAAQYLITH